MTRRISAVIPVRNGMPYIAETIESLRRQTHKADEIVVVDNCSTDGTSEYLDKQADIRVIHQPQSVSAPQNWTAAARSATGDYTKVLCADDILLPNCLEWQREILDTNPDCAMTAARRQVIGPDSSVLVKAIGLSSLQGVVSGDRALRRGISRGTNLFGEVAAVMFRTNVLQAQLPWPDDAGYATDLAMYAKVLQQSNVYLDRRVLAQFRVVESSWSFQIRSSQARDVIRTYREIASKQNLSVSPLAHCTGTLTANIRQILRSLMYLRVARLSRRQQRL